MKRRVWAVRDSNKSRTSGNWLDTLPRFSNIICPVKLSGRREPALRLRLISGMQEILSHPSIRLLQGYHGRFPGIPWLVSELDTDQPDVIDWSI